jgi:ABC-2 type transport system permease protein
LSARRVRAVARRIVAQFRHDRRSLALLIVAPLVVLTLVGALWGSDAHAQPRITVDALSPAAAPLADALRGAGLDVRMTLPVLMTVEESARDALTSGRADAVIIVGSGGPKIVVEGSDPNRTAGTIAAVQAALLRASAGAGAARPQVEYLYGGPDLKFLDFLAPVLIAVFGYFFMLLLSTVSFQRERASGTLERLLATPLRRGELVLGYLAGFSFFALVQAVVIIAFTLFVLKVQFRGSVATIFLIEAVLVIGAVSLGLFISAFARNELQAVQFMPLVLVPQLFLSGLLVPLEQLSDVLRAISTILPLTYANEALRAVMVKGYPLGDPLVLRDLAVIAGFAIVTVFGAIASIRREVA